MHKRAEADDRDGEVVSAESLEHDEDGSGGIGDDKSKPRDGVTDSGTTQAPTTASETASDKSKPVFRGQRIMFGVAGLLVIVTLVTGGAMYWVQARHFETTDDAAIDGYIAQVSAQVAGRVVRLAVTDNQLVVAGQLLIEIDPSDFDLRLEQAKSQYEQAVAQLEQARAQVANQRALIAQAGAQVRVTEADLTQAAQDLDRYRAIDPKAITHQQLDAATAQASSAGAQLDANKQALSAASAQLRALEAKVANAEASVQGNQVSVRNAKLQLSYTRITAPVAGRVTRRTVDIGNYVNPGQLLLNVVPSGMWVTANFKETQLASMRVGQPADVRIDAIPDHVFRGHIDSFQKGTGSVFSSLPAENATGNFVKVLQRIPVKIALDEANDPRLSLGLSVVPQVRVR